MKGSRSSLLGEACDWAAGLRLSDIPDDVLLLARAQTTAVLGSVRASLRHPVSPRLRALYPGDGWGPAAATAAAHSIALDWDETLFAGHTGHSCVLTPLAVARATGADGEAVLVAQVAATEVAARLTAALTLGRSRGQAASHTHAAGAVIGAGLVLGLPGDALLAALGRALRSHRPVELAAFMGGEAKFGVAAEPILSAARILLAGDSSPAPLSDPGDDPLEGPGGLFETIAEVALPEAFGGYGSRWHLRSLSIKAIPGCAYLSAAAEAAAELAPLDAADIDSVTVEASIFTLRMEAESAPFLARERTPLPALGFSAAYNVATALETGTVGVADLHGAALAAPSRWDLADRVRLVHAPDLTEAALTASAPVGAALGWAGGRARAYLVRGGAPDDLAGRVLAATGTRLAADAYLDHPDKRIGARVRVRLRDGREFTAERGAAAGGCQQTVDSRVALAVSRAAGGGVEVEAASGLQTLDPGQVVALWPL